MTLEFIPTRTAALERLAAFAPLAGRNYAARRNFDLGEGEHVHVSCLSPYLRCRLVTEQEVLETVLAHHSAAASEKFVQEVFWRSYWKGWLEMRPGVWDQYQIALGHAWDDVQTQAGLRARWEAACRGETDIDCFNTWAQELVSTGYLHNHARMWFASIWIFTLRLPWELGADFFLRHLLDGDPASNTLGWRWVAGIQTLGKTYLARTSNISKFTEGRFHPKWQLSSDAQAISGPTAPEPRTLTPLPPVDPNLRTGFLLHEEDLSPGFAYQGITPAACGVLAPQTHVGPLQTSPQVTVFRAAAGRDAAGRWFAGQGGFTELSDNKAVLAWAKDARLEQVVTPYAPVGPVSTLLTQLAQTPDAPHLCKVMRPFDKMTWPHATRGFFPFKKNIPDFISHLNENHTQ